MAGKLKVAFVRALWHREIVDQACRGYEAGMKAAGVAHETRFFEVPGAFEMPLLAKRLGQTGDYDAIVAAALVVDGGIYRHDFVAQAVVTGLMQAQMETGVPTFSVSLTPHNFHDCEEHRTFFHDHFLKKGAEVASAVRDVCALGVYGNAATEPARRIEALR
ncbi:6,7-dimethyl-8-ribityllumazine synthase [Lutimaribacter pacificus]|uniref:6,7-dimethyl-8-ribityllumazine synthase n=1 Tax=Lutimaribacter pacificus TaxID=391948 RepID=A0A1H0M2H7_9RHOB|nr:6,7-dimethyl-8-ribityllumazine synthase [Lutimaribacter pacificus]SDO74603.1 6,7-dimethyl-8-ribityllumazine synthase [Lutimaribacter pacificus]SHK76991.1 6,7-dimethyl-8-ribityllumazine synthase [Lutimaribacter pacificus]